MFPNTSFNLRYVHILSFHFHSLLSNYTQSFSSALDHSDIAFLAQWKKYQITFRQEITPTGLCFLRHLLLLESKTESEESQK